MESKHIMKKKYFIVSLICIFIFFTFIIYKDIYNKWTSPPSDKWARHIEISDDIVAKELKMVKFQKNFYILYDSEDKLKVMVIDECGKKINEKIIEIKNDIFFDINLFKNENEIIVNWITTSNNVRTLNSVVFDKDLQEKNRYKNDNVVDSYQISENAMLIQYKDKLEFIDFKENIKLIKPFKANLVSGTLTKDGYLIAYHEGDNAKYFYIKDGVIGSESTAFQLKVDDKNLVSKIETSSDEKNVYIITGKFIAGEQDKYDIYIIDKATKNVSKKSFRDLGINSIYNLKVVPSEQEVRFLAETTRTALIKNKHEIDIIDFSINEGKLKNFKFATKTIDNSSRGCISDNNMIFYTYNTNEKGNICMTSQNEKFKEYSNNRRQGEIKNILGVTAGEIFTTVFYCFFQGAWWIAVGLVSISLVSFIFYDTCKKRQRKIAFVLCYILMSGIKLQTMYEGMYIDKNCFLPKVFNQPLIGVGLMILISALSFMYSYGIYKKDTETVPILSFIRGLVIDTFLSSLMIVPFLK